MSAVDKQSLIKELGKMNYERLFELLAALRRRETAGSYLVARNTAEFYRVLVSSAPWNTPEEAISSIHKLGNILTQAQPIELCLGNITRRVLFFIREARQKKTKKPFDLGLDRFDEVVVDFKALKAGVVEEINNLLDELDCLHQNISNQALDHIHSNEIIMTYGRSNTVVSFLKSAGRRRKFHVVVTESAPSYKGKQTAKDLAEAGIDSTLIADSAIFCMMSRVNKVVVGTNAVLANGGLLALSGVRMLAEAAKYYSVPFVVISGMYKLSPIYPSGRDFIHDMSSPGQIISFTEVDTIRRTHVDLDEIDTGVDVLNPLLDYIPPELVSLYLTNYGVHNPSYIYRMLAEYYSLQDYALSSKYDENLIKVKNILALAEEEVADALDWFLQLNHSFDINQHIEVISLQIINNNVLIVSGLYFGMFSCLTTEQTLLEIACERNNVDIARLLLAREDLKLNEGIALEIACEHEHVEVAKILLSHPNMKVEDSVLQEYGEFISSIQKQ